MTRKLSALLVMCLFTACASGAWAAYYDEHSGTEADPYIISSVEDITALSDRVNSGDEPGGAYYRLSSPLTISGYETWNPIGSEPNAFTGHFDGGSNTITMSIDNPAYRASVFGLIGTPSGYAVKNLKVAGTIRGKFVGGIAAVIDYGTDASIEGCEFSGTLESEYQYNSSDSASDNHTSAGGIVEVIQSGTVKNCTVRNAAITANRANAGVSAYAGGIAAAMGGGLVESCTVTGTKIESFGTDSYSGGIVGSSNWGRIQACNFTGDVKGDGYAACIVGRMENGNLDVGDVNVASNTVRASVTSSDILGGWAALVGYIMNSGGSILTNSADISINGEGLTEEIAQRLVSMLLTGVGQTMNPGNLTISDNHIDVTIPDKINVEVGTSGCNFGFGLAALAGALLLFRRK